MECAYAEFGTAMLSGDGIESGKLTLAATKVEISFCRHHAKSEQVDPLPHFRPENGHSVRLLMLVYGRPARMFLLGVVDLSLA
jgi:hypothetical protein